MNGGSLRHGIIASSVLASVHTQLDRAHFGVCSGDVKLVANGRVRHPDIVVFRLPPDLGTDTATDPVVVVEIVSPSTRIADRFDKNVDYATHRGIIHYLMLWETERLAVLCTRTADDWVSQELGAVGSVALPAIGVELNLDDVYRQIPFPDPT